VNINKRLTDEEFQNNKEKFLVYEKHLSQLKESGYKGILNLRKISVNSFVDVGSVFDKMDPYVIF
jgi:hypothetical protein